VFIYASMNLPIAVWMMRSFLAEVAGFITSQGLFLAKVCAAATIISLPVLAAGFAAQDKLVQGLSLGG